MLSKNFHTSVEGLRKAEKRLNKAADNFLYRDDPSSPPPPIPPITSTQPSPSTPPLAWMIKDGFRYPYQNNSQLFQGDDTLLLIEGTPHKGLIFDVYEGNNMVIGDSTANTIRAGNGDNIIRAQDGDDTITVGNGNNYIDGGRGKNHIHAGTGRNIYVFEGEDGIQVIHDYHYESDFIFLKELSHTMNKDGHLMNGFLTGNGHLALYFKHLAAAFNPNDVPKHEIVIKDFDLENGYITLVDQDYIVDYFPAIPAHLMQHSDEL